LVSLSAALAGGSLVGMLEAGTTAAFALTVALAAGAAPAPLLPVDAGAGASVLAQTGC